MKQYGGHGMNIALGLPWNFGMKEGIAPFKGGQPITNLKQYIAQKGQPYWKQLEHAAYELGRPELLIDILRQQMLEILEMLILIYLLNTQVSWEN